jgi:prevent-host-death family protein
MDLYIDKNMVMIKVNVFEIKAKLSEYLDRAAKGERIVICRHNQPVAELRPVEAVRTEPRPVGSLPGRPAFDVPSSFFDPLPDEDLDLWDGVTALSGPRPSKAGGSASTAAEIPAPHGKRPGRRTSRRPAAPKPSAKAGRA